MRQCDRIRRAYDSRWTLFSLSPTENHSRAALAALIRWLPGASAPAILDFHFDMMHDLLEQDVDPRASWPRPRWGRTEIGAATFARIDAHHLGVFDGSAMARPRRVLLFPFALAAGILPAADNCWLARSIFNIKDSLSSVTNSHRILLQEPE